MQTGIGEWPTPPDKVGSDVAACLAEVAGLPATRLRTLRRPHRDIRTVGTVALHYFRYGIGGGEKVTYELMKLFQSMGMRVLLYTDELPGPDDYPIPVGAVRKFAPNDSSELTQRARFWIDEVRNEGIDAMVYNSWHAPTALLDCMAIQSGGACFIYHTHGSLPYSMMVDDDDLPRRMEALGRLADCVIALSRMDTVFWSAYSDNVACMVNPVARYLEGLPTRSETPGGKTVLWVGRMAEFDKRPGEAVRVFSAVHAASPDVRFIMCGDGPDFASVKESAERLGLSGSIDFTGYRENPLSLYQQANALLITSVSEGFPLVLSEAMQQGIPTVLYDLPFLAHFERESGCIRIPWGDSQAAADALCALLDDRCLQEELSMAQSKAFRSLCSVDLASSWKRLLERTACVAREDSKFPPFVAQDGDNAPQFPWEETVAMLMRAAVFDFDQHLMIQHDKVKRLTDELARERRESETLRSELNRVRAELEDVYSSKRYRMATKIADLAKWPSR